MEPSFRSDNIFPKTSGDGRTTYGVRTTPGDYKGKEPGKKSGWVDAVLLPGFLMKLMKKLRNFSVG